MAAHARGQLFDRNVAHLRLGGAAGVTDRETQGTYRCSQGPQGVMQPPSIA